MTNRAREILLLAGLLLSALPVAGQSDVSTGSLRGSVFDPSSKVIASAVVTVTDVNRNIDRTVETDASGEYLLPYLQPGTYDVRVEAPGFLPAVLKAVNLSLGQIVSNDFHLLLRANQESMNVDANVQLVDAFQTQQANPILAPQITNYPNLDRNFLRYVYTLPGVSDANAPRAQGNGYFLALSTGLSIGASNGRANLVTIDGGENDFGDGQIRYQLSQQAIQELQVNRNGFAAEFGFTLGTAINVVTKGGGAQTRGTVYGYFRNQVTSSRNFFDKGNKKAFDQQFYPGFSLGGPLKARKLFYFLSYETPRSATAIFRSFTSNPALLDADSSQQAFLARMTASGDPNLQRISGILAGQLNIRNSANAMALLRRDEGTFSDRLNDHLWLAKLDYEPGERHHLSLRWNGYLSNPSASRCQSSPTCISNQILTDRQDQTILFNWTQTLSSARIHQLRVQFSPFSRNRFSARDTQGTEISIGGLGTFGRAFAAPFDTTEKRIQVEDVVSYVANNHFFKFGVSLRPASYTVEQGLWFGGSWTFPNGVYPIITALSPADQGAVVGFNRGTAGLPAFTGLQAFAQGLPLLFRQGYGNPRWSRWSGLYAGFAQDTWQATRQLTINYGARWDADLEAKPLGHNHNASFRLGLAWNLRNNGRTVFRAGAGTFFAPIGYNIAYITKLLDDSGENISQTFKTAGNAISIWQPGLALGKLPFRSLTVDDLNRLGVPTVARGAGRAVFTAAPGYANPYTVQFHAGVSHLLAPGTAVEVAFQRYRGVHLQVPHETNYRTSGQSLDGVGPLLTPIDPSIAQLNTYNSIGNSSYNGLTASLIRSLRSRVSFQLHYTYSHAIDDTTDYNSAFAAMDPTNLRLERASSTFDIRHNFVASAVMSTAAKGSGVWNYLTRDVTFAPILFARSSIPFTLLLGGDRNGDTHSGDRPIFASRNTGRGEPFFSVDARITKRIFSSREGKLGADFILEGVNLLNHTNFEAVNNLSAGNQPKFLSGPFPPGVFNVRGNRELPQSAPLAFVSAFTPRRLQLGLRIFF